MLLLHLGELFPKREKCNEAIDYYTEACDVLRGEVRMPSRMSLKMISINKVRRCSDCASFQIFGRFGYS